MQLDAQRERLLERTEGRRDDDRNLYEGRRRRQYDVVEERPYYADRKPQRRELPPQTNNQGVEKMKADLGKIAEDTLRNMPQNLRPTEVLFVITIMIKMVCLLIEDE